MSRRERMLAALNRQQPDRVPIDLGGAEFSTMTVPAYKNLQTYLGMHHEPKMLSIIHSVVHPDEEVLKRFDVDTRIVQPGGLDGSPHEKWLDDNTYVDIFGVRWERTVGSEANHFLHQDGPFYDGKLSIDAIDAFEWPEGNNPGLSRGVAERVAEIKAMDEEYAIMLYLPGGIIHRGYAMRSFEKYLKDLYKNKEALQRLMTKLCDYWVDTAKQMIEAAGPENIDNVFFGEDLSTQEGCMFDPEGIYATYIKPHHRRMVETVKSYRRDMKVVFHCCGSAYSFIPHLIDIGVDGLNPVQVTAKNMEPERLKEEFGDKICFWGGINSQSVLPFGTPEEVRKETRRIISILGEGGGYVLNSVHNIQPEVPPENVVAMFEEGMKHRYAKAA
ncbi:MAG: uroporphyrinogen decarboxylase family protein [Alphaproteobacteria bacterium]|nr:uroporphyrinogen decarboxylase family protein [Alphaproteobacteria bacterium]